MKNWKGSVRKRLWYNRGIVRYCLEKWSKPQTPVKMAKNRDERKFRPFALYQHSGCTWNICRAVHTCQGDICCADSLYQFARPAEKTPMVLVFQPDGRGMMR